MANEAFRDEWCWNMHGQQAEDLDAQRVLQLCMRRVAARTARLSEAVQIAQAVQDAGIKVRAVILPS